MRDESGPPYLDVKKLSYFFYSVRFTACFRRETAATILAIAILFLSPALGWAEPVGYPGGMWGQVTHDDDQVSGSGGMGWIHQGIDWASLPGDVMLNTYAEYRYRTRELNRKYYDTQGPAVGIELRKDFITVGSAVYWEKLPELGTSSTNKELYVTWYYDWNANSGNKFGPFAFPGSWWGNLTYDVDGLNGSGAQGFVNQGVDWFTLPGGVVANTFVEYRHRSRTKNNQYYDAGGPAVGVDFRKWFLHFGVNYYWESLPMLNESSNRAQFYLTWYYTWDVKDMFPKNPVHTHVEK